MGLYFFGQPGTGAKKGARGSQPVSKESLAILRKQGCKTCSLDKESKNLISPKMPASGSEKPDFYLLGEAPGETEDEQDEQFVGVAGDRVRDSIGGSIGRWRLNNVINCHPPNNRDPLPQEIECCRQYIHDDIEKTKPKVIIGTGNVPLAWATGGEVGIQKWAGRKFPIRIGKHVCWFMPVVHPSFLVRQGGVSVWEPVFDRQIQDIICDVDLLPTPTVIDDGYLEGVDWVFGKGDSDVSKVKDWLDELRSFDKVGIDIETQNLRPYNKDSRMLTVAIGDDTSTYAFPIDHPKAWGTSRRRNKVIDLFGDFIADSGVKIAQNLKFEQEWFAYYYGIEILSGTDWEDTMSLAFVLDERKGMLNLDVLVFMEFGFWLKSLSPPMNKSRMVDEPLTKVLPYNGLDTKWTYALFNRRWIEISKNKNKKLIGVYRESQVDASATLVAAQLLGMRPDFDEVDRLSCELEGKIDTAVRGIKALPASKKFRKLYGREFNPASDGKDVPLMFKEVLGRSEGVKRGGGYSTDVKVLSLMDVAEVPLAPLLLDFRRYSTLKGTFVDPAYKLVYPDGLFHTDYKITWVVTGRISSEDPNSQNYPRRRDKYIRKIILAHKGSKLCSFDYGQIDARNIAMYSEDEAYCDALWQGEDIHQRWTDRLLDAYPRKLDEIYDNAKDYDMVTDRTNEKQLVKAFRDLVKNQWTFPCFYGSTADDCAHHLGVPNRVTREIYDEFWDVYRGVKKWQEWLLDFYNDHLYVETMQGRRRHGPMKKNEILNSPIQGTTAEIVINAMSRCYKLAQKKKDNSYQPFMQIHDDLTFSILDDAKFDGRIKLVSKVMCQVPFSWISVPIVIEVKVGSNWFDQKEYVEYSSEDF